MHLDLSGFWFECLRSDWSDSINQEGKNWKSKDLLLRKTTTPKTGGVLYQGGSCFILVNLAYFVVVGFTNAMSKLSVFSFTVYLFVYLHLADLYMCVFEQCVPCLCARACMCFAGAGAGGCAWVCVCGVTTLTDHPKDSKSDPTLRDETQSHEVLMQLCKQETPSQDTCARFGEIEATLIMVAGSPGILEFWSLRIAWYVCWTRVWSGLLAFQGDSLFSWFMWTTFSWNAVICLCDAITFAHALSLSLDWSILPTSQHNWMVSASSLSLMAINSCFAPSHTQTHDVGIPCRECSSLSPGS